MKLKCPKCNGEVKLARARKDIALCFFCGISFLINEKKNQILKENINIEVKDIDIKPKDINWRNISDESFRKFPEAELLVLTEITTRTTMSRYINDRNIDETVKERVLYWAFLNQPT